MTPTRIRGGLVIDGTGAPARPADVHLRGGRITAIEEAPADRGDASPGDAGRADRSGVGQRTIDATGLVVCPGFIDMHAHADLALIREPDRLSAVSQGVTTEVIGQDGLSYAPITPAAAADLHGRIRGWNGDLPDGGIAWASVPEFLERVSGAAVNVAYLAPHGTLRLLVMGTERRPTTPTELDRMAGLLADALAGGAVGMSTGLTYVPAMFADDAELTRLCEVLAAHGGYYAPHHRSYGAGAIEAYAECLDLGRRTGVAVHLTHAHLSYAVNRGRAPELLALVDAALADGVDVTLDSYPYIVGSSYLHSALPSFLQQGSVDEIVELLARPDVRDDLAERLERRGTTGSHRVPVDWSRVVIGSATDTSLPGLSIAELAQRRGARAIDAYCDVLISERLGAMCLVHEGDEANLRAVLSHPRQCAGSDGLLAGQRPHPRAFGTFARYLGEYSRGLALVPLELMIHKMTALPAGRIGLADRGVLAVGAAADVVCFDPATVADRATFDQPRLTAVGIHHVLVNGEPVLTDTEPTGARPGRAVTNREAA
ncbi:amidohydrolase family protein [Occultella aeris]|uniref:D-aminoacylase n=1 Tax=Occultella aeris TaxID=2761496 RepID=A0A7M4DSH4_9MICO|nr:D-aminoacylase [Occultella aeris]VZO40418.1 D-aminoacylase [Occultella aeris]